MEMALALLWIPLISSLIPGLISLSGTSKGRVLSKVVGPMLMGCVALISIDVLLSVLKKGPITGSYYTWAVIENMSMMMGLYVDELVAIMCCVVSIVSFLVHLYSVGYMSQDPSLPRFMSYLSLFTFFMLFLVTSSNLIQLFVGWEGVGLSSYLLIGFWTQKDSANQASIKAFITNRIGDMGMMLGIAAVLAVFSTLDIPTILNAVDQVKDHQFSIGAWNVHGLSMISMFFLIGAMAKSAQFGLHVWLPDAMEGPTPVSALIHAATMVTAGVFLIIRLSVLFEQAPDVLQFMIYLGAFTALFAGCVALMQDDIKRVIAYSTCSQLGYMFMACGVSMYGAALFHLVTHAFFKALLFLGAGSAIHGMSGEQNMHKMGGLASRIKITYGFMWVGSLAIAGAPFFSGFYSKEWILESLWKYGHTTHQFIPYMIGLLAAFLTVIYSWRLLWLVFHGESNADERVQAHIHESPFIMLIPMGVLAIGAVFAGIGLKGLFISQTLEDAFHIPHHTGSVPLYVHVLPIIILATGIAGTVYIYHYKKNQINEGVKKISAVYSFLRNKAYIDEVYNVLLIQPVIKSGAMLRAQVDRGIIDRWGPHGLANIAQWLSKRLRHVQTGHVIDYTLIIWAGIVILIGWFLWIV